MRAAAVQLNSNEDKERNLASADELTRAAAADGAQLVVLPEKFNVLGTHQHYAEGAETPAMMSVGMHARLLGRPGRLRALQRFLDHVEAHDRVWITRRVDIARHWKATHPFNAQTAFVWE